jgi:predicted LPLAT superfamily acyltransferase
VSRGKLGLAFRGHDESLTSANKGNYVEVLKLVAIYNASHKEHIEGNDVFRGMFPETQNELIASVSEYMMTEIKEEVSEAEFVALIIDEAINIGAKAQMSTVLRYIMTN